MERPSWNKYFMDIATLTSTRSNCCRRNVGCVVVKNKRIISTGYNGTPFGIENCLDGACERCFSRNNNSSSTGSNLDLCICLHAEQNALLFASMDELNGSSLYTTSFPCLGCTKQIIQCKIKEVFYLEKYCSTTEEISIDLFKKAGITIHDSCVF